jgi:hypothetical protein
MTALALAALQCMAGERVAMVTDRQGESVLVGGRPLSILDELARGAQISIAAGAVLTLVYLASGREYNVHGAARLALGAQGPQLAAGEAARVRDLALAKETGMRPSGEGSLAQTSVRMRGAGGRRELSLREPRGKVLSTRPGFVWQGRDDASRYEIELRDGDGVALFRAATETPRAELPAGLTLARGATYRWRVRARLPSGTPITGRARFEVADEALWRAVGRLRPRADASVSERVVYGLWLEQEGLAGEARELWRTLAAARPGAAALGARAGVGPLH